MTDLQFQNFTTRLRQFIKRSPNCQPADEFNELALSLFHLQFIFNQPYRRYCQNRGISPGAITHWNQIPAIPVQAFKGYDHGDARERIPTCLPPEDRPFVFHSSGTTGQNPSRHFHNAESLRIYEASLSQWFHANLLTGRGPGEKLRMIFLTPPQTAAPHSSLVHMFETLRLAFGSADSVFVGDVNSLSPSDGERAGVRGSPETWRLDISKTISILQQATRTQKPLAVFGTAFNFVHLLDAMAELSLDIRLPPGSWVLETGGYKGRSRALSKTDLHALITQHLEVPSSQIFCEYGMCELSSQAYDSPTPGIFHFPPWARAQIISPETGLEVAEGERGLIRVFDLANVYSVMAIQTEDLGARRDYGFELLGRAAVAEPRGCSLMSLA